MAGTLEAHFSGMTRLVSYAEVGEVFRSKAFEQVERKRGIFVEDSLIALSGADHFERRRIESPLFGRQGVVTYERSVMLPAVEQAIHAHRTGAGRLDLVPFVRTLYLKVAVALIGLDDAQGAALEELRRCTDDIQEGINVDWSRRPHDQVVNQATRARDLLAERWFRPSWARRRSLVDASRQAADGEAGLPTDLLTTMILHEDHFGRWRPDVFLREVVMFLAAAVNTPTNGTLHAVQEIGGWLREHPGDATKLRDRAFLRAAISEALRLHAASPATLRRAARDVVLSSGRSVRAGEIMALDVAAANRDREVFGDDAESYRIPRMLPSRPFGLVFGSGPHTCLGMALSIGQQSESEASGGTSGLLVLILDALYRAGMRLDPLSPPLRNPWTAQDRYISFPVLLDPMGSVELAKTSP